MKKTIIIPFIFFSKLVLSQNLIQKNGCVEMYAESYVTNTGAEYNAWIENNCSEYVFVRESFYQATFRVVGSSGNERNSKKKIKFKEAFIAPNTKLARSRQRNDNNSTTYLNLKDEYAALGDSYYIHLEAPDGFNEKQAVDYGKKTLIGKEGELYVYAELVTNFWASWSGFEQYKLKITAENKGASIIKNIYVDFTVNFYGINYSSKEQFNTVKPGQTKDKSTVLEPIFNFTPTAYLELNPGSTIKPPSVYTKEKLAELFSENYSDEAMYQHCMQAHSEGSNEANNIAKYIVDNTSNIKLLNDFASFSWLKNDIKITANEKIINSANANDSALFLAHWRVATNESKLGQSLWSNEDFEQADHHFSNALKSYNKAKKLMNFAPDTETKTSFSGQEQEHIKYAQQYADYLKNKVEKEFNQLMIKADEAIINGDFTEAGQLYDKAIQLNFNNTLAKESKDYLNQISLDIDEYKKCRDELLIGDNTYLLIHLNNTTWMINTLRETGSKNEQYTQLTNDKSVKKNTQKAYYDSNESASFSDEKKGYLYTYEVVYGDSDPCPENWQMPMESDLIEAILHLGGKLESEDRFNKIYTVPGAAKIFYEPNLVVATQNNSSGFITKNTDGEISPFLHKYLGYTNTFWVKTKDGKASVVSIEIANPKTSSFLGCNPSCDYTIITISSLTVQVGAFPCKCIKKK